MRFLFTLFFLYGVSIHAVFAHVAITEIMYDLPGSDSGREWIEIQNVGTEPIDISSWRFYEEDTNHRLTPVSGGTVLNPQGYAIVADNAERFLADWQNFTGTLFDSSFSLKNDSEHIILRDNTLQDIHSITYSSNWGAGGNGFSLQLVNGNWVEGKPTPGAFNRKYSPPVVREIKENTKMSQEKEIAIQEFTQLSLEESTNVSSEEITEPLQFFAVSEADSSGGLFKWLLALLGIASIGTAASILFRRGKSKEEIKILED